MILSPQLSTSLTTGLQGADSCKTTLKTPFLMDLIAKAVTLKSIKLNDPTAKNLLFSAKHSVLYTFDPQSSGWVNGDRNILLIFFLPPLVF